MINKAVIPAAGLGTRLLPITKELPKEMLPIFVRDKDDSTHPKPILQAIFEQLYNVGFRDYCFVVGREKRAIEDHFTPDLEYLKRLGSHANQLQDLRRFYDITNNSNIVWVNQPEPRGFGDAVLRAESFVGNSSFLCHAGDTIVISRDNAHLNALCKLSEQEKCDAIFIAHRMKNPTGYGIVEGEKVSERILAVGRVVEKPKKPKSNIAIMPLYVFKPSVFEAIRKVGRGFGGEVQLTDAIQRLIDLKCKVYAYLLSADATCFDIGTVETWWKALFLTHSRSRIRSGN